MADDEKKALMVTGRERDAIIAALRFWQRQGNEPDDDEYEIATNGREGDDATLTNDEIDELIEERINV